MTFHHLLEVGTRIDDPGEKKVNRVSSVRDNGHHVTTVASIVPVHAVCCRSRNFSAES